MLLHALWPGSMESCGPRSDIANGSTGSKCSHQERAYSRTAAGNKLSYLDGHSAALGSNGQHFKMEDAAFDFGLAEGSSL